MDTDACKPGEHLFRTSRETNEPVGRCQHCNADLDWVESQWEEAEDLEAAMPSDSPEPTPSDDLLAAWAQADVDRIRLSDLGA